MEQPSEAELLVTVVLMFIDKAFGSSSHLGVGCFLEKPQCHHRSTSTHPIYYFGR